MLLEELFLFELGFLVEMVLFDGVLDIGKPETGFLRFFVKSKRLAKLLADVRIVLGDEVVVQLRSVCLLFAMRLKFDWFRSTERGLHSKDVVELGV